MEDRVIVKFNGGLGNQMFQWALARAIAETTGMEARFDMSYFNRQYARPYELDVFKVEPKFVVDAWTIIRLKLIWALRSFLNWKDFLGITLYSESHFNFDKNINKIKSNAYIIGFFQSELYFTCVEDKLREDFKFEKEPDAKNMQIISQMYATNSIAIHIRRGDYVEKQRYQNLYATCSPDYYKRGVEYIAQKYPNPTLYIFSDDIRWAKQNIRLPYETVYISHNTGKKSYEDMRLMSLCRHNIIANSSFSWWGAWLNKNKEKIVIAPQKWFNDDEIIQTDIIPKDWIRLEN